MNDLKENKARPVVFGEVLFDDFEDGPSVIGGAAFNLAWNLECLGLAPLFISRIGDDRLGEQVLEIMRSCGMDTSGVQVDAALPTGTVSVRLSAGEPEYTINDCQAYDAIDATEALTALGESPVSMLYHGSLALRSEGSRAALDVLAGRLAGEIIVDVNLRQPWWKKEQVRADLSRARWAKLNDEELRELSSQPPVALGGLLEEAGAFRKELDLEVLFLTLGSEGAAILGPAEEVFELPAEAASQLIDTVGAGDAFTAIAMLGLSAGWPGAVILERAVEFAAAACCLEGATTSRREHYGGFLQGWGLQEEPGSLRG
mgnify:FL=1